MMPRQVKSDWLGPYIFYLQHRADSFKKKNKKKVENNLDCNKKVLSLYHKTNISKMNTLTIKTKKLQFGNNNEVKGWFKLTNGERTDFHITNDGEIKQTGTNNKKIHPFVIGLYEMLFSND